MKVEIREVAPEPPPKEVVITMSVAEAKDLHNRLYNLMTNGPSPAYGDDMVIRRLQDGLTNASVQTA